MNIIRRESHSDLLFDLYLPVILKGEKGDKGDTPVIGENGNWWIGGKDTGKPSRGLSGRDVECIFLRTKENIQPAAPVATDGNDGNAPGEWTNDPAGVNGIFPYEWISMRFRVDGKWSSFSNPALWSKFSFDGADGTDYEYIFMRTAVYSQPPTPATSQTDDYVPGGWTDDPQGVSIGQPYEWVSKRFKVGGSWSEFSVPALWARYSRDGSDGRDGLDGRDGTDYEYIFTRTTTETHPSTPPSVNEDRRVPEGWTNDPQGISVSFPYEWASKRYKIGGEWKAFSPPALWAKFGFNGARGEPGATPQIGGNGNWWIDGVDTGKPSQGPAGKDASTEDFISRRTTSLQSVAGPILFPRLPIVRAAELSSLGVTGNIKDVTNYRGYYIVDDDNTEYNISLGSIFSTNGFQNGDWIGVIIAKEPNSGNNLHVYPGTGTFIRYRGEIINTISDCLNLGDSLYMYLFVYIGGGWYLKNLSDHTS